MSKEMIPKRILGVVFFLMPIVFAPLILTEQFEIIKQVLMWLGLGMTIWILDFRFPGRDWIGWGMLAMLVSAMFSIYYSIQPRMSLWGNPLCPNGFVTFVGYVGIYFVAKRLLAHPIDGWKFLKLCLPASVIVCVYAIAQFFGWDFIIWKDQLKEFGIVRPGAMMGHPNSLGAYLVMSFLVLLAVRNGFFKKFKVIFGVLFGAVILMTQSRGTWMALVAGTLMYLWWNKKAGNKILFGVCGIIAVLPLAGTIISRFLVSPENYPFIWNATSRLAALLSFKGARWEYMMGALRIWEKYPIFGSGVDTFQISFQHQRTAIYWAMEPGGSPHRAHNEFLNVLATQGSVGAIAMGILIWAIVRQCEKLHKGNNYHALLVSLVTAFAVQSISSLTVVTTGFFMVVVLALISGVTTKVNEKIKFSVFRFVMMMIVLILVGVGSYRAVMGNFYAGQSKAMQLKYPEGALYRASQAVKVAPGSDQYALLMSGCLELMAIKTKDLRYMEFAIKWAQKAVELNPAQAFNRYVLGLMLLKVNRPDLAKRPLDVAVALEPFNPVYAKRGMK